MAEAAADNIEHFFVLFKCTQGNGRLYRRFLSDLISRSPKKVVVEACHVVFN